LDNQKEKKRKQNNEESKEIRDSAAHYLVREGEEAFGLIKVARQEKGIRRKRRKDK